MTNYLTEQARITKPRVIFHFLPIVLFCVIFFLTWFVLAPFLPITPDISMALLYFFILFNPKLLPLSLIFALSMIQDSLSGVYLGTHGFLLIICWILLTHQRRYLFNKNIAVLWATFAVLITLTTTLKIALLELFQHVPWNGFLIILQNLMTIAIVPFIYKISYFILGRSSL